MPFLKRMRQKLTGEGSEPSSTVDPDVSRSSGSDSQRQPDLEDGAAYLERGNHHFSEGNLQAALADFQRAIELSSDASELVAAYFNRGRTYSRTGHWDFALTDFDQVAEQAPGFPLLYLERGVCFALKEDNLNALAEFDRATALLPPGIDLAKTYCNRGVTYSALGNYQAALADINKAIETAPEFTPAYEERERVQERARSAREGPAGQSTSEQPTVSAEEYCERGWADSQNENLVDALVNFGRAIEQDPNYHNAYYSRGVINAKLRRYEQAMADLNKALELVPRFPAALTERGLVYVELGNSKQGMLDYDRAIEIDPSYAIAHINKGSLYALQEEWEDALVSLEMGMRLDPQNPDAYINHAAASQHVGDYSRATEDFKTYLQLFPQGPYAEYARKRLKKLEGESINEKRDQELKASRARRIIFTQGTVSPFEDDPAIVIEACDRAIELDPNDATAYCRRGIAHSVGGNFAAAISDFDKALAILTDPSVRAGVYSDRGIAYARHGDPVAALADFEKCIELDPTNINAYNNRGNLYASEGKLAGAIADYSRAAELNPNFSDTLNNRGNAYCLQGNLNAALADYDRAIEIHPDYADAHFNRGRVHIALGDVRAALTDLRRCLELCPNAPYRTEAEKLMVELKAS